jgi:general secretion pathway protein A
MGYERTFGLRDAPFENVPDPRFYYATGHHDEALAVLEYALLRAKGPCVLAGPSGTGKSMLLERLCDRLATRTHVLTVRAGELNRRSLIAALNHEFVRTPRRRPERGEAAPPPFAELRTAVTEAVHRGDGVLVIVDDAEQMRRRHWMELLALAKLETARRRLVQIAILGAPDVIDRLMDSRIERFRRQLFRIVRLAPLTPAQSAAYVSHRLAVVGAGADSVFAPGSVDLISRLAGGIPAMINQLCDNALLEAYADGAPRAAVSHVRHVAADAMLLPAVRAEPVQSLLSRPTIHANPLDADARAAPDPFETVRRNRAATLQSGAATPPVAADAYDQPASAPGQSPVVEVDETDTQSMPADELAFAGIRAGDAVDDLVAALRDANRAARALCEFVAPTASSASGHRLNRGQ